MTSARKNKSRLNKSKLAALKKLNDAQPIVLSEQSLQEVGDELVRSTIAGFEDELSKSSPVVKGMAKIYAGTINEFFKGFKIGVDEEIKNWLQGSEKVLANAAEKISEPLKEAVQLPAPNATPTRQEKEYINLNNRDLAKNFTDREEPTSERELSRTTKVGRFVTSALADSVGMKNLVTNHFEASDKKANFVDTELKMRGMNDTRANRKSLRQDYNEIQKGTAQLQKLEKSAAMLRAQGYTDEQINKQLGHDDKRAAILPSLLKADPSRAPQTPAPSVPTSFNEESKNEQMQMFKEEQSEQTEQTKLLADILKVLREKGISGASPVAASESDSISLGTGLLSGVKKYGGKALSTIKDVAKGGMKMANSPITGALGKGLAIAGAGTAVYDGVSQLADGKAVESAGDIVPEGWSKLNPFDWAMRGGMYAGDKINKGVSAATGGESIGGMAYSAVDSVKGMLGFSNDETKTKQAEAQGKLDYAKKAIAEGRPISKQLAEDVRKQGMEVPANLIKGSELAITNNMVQNTNVPSAITKSDPASAPETVAKEIGKNIVVNVPAPTVIGGGSSEGKKEIIAQPFTNMIKNREPSVSDYLRSRYA